MLEGLGLEPVIEELYVLLVREPDLDATELRARLEVLPGDLSAHLEVLIGLGLLRRDASLPCGAAVVRPDVSLDALLARQQAEVLAAQERIRSVREALQSLEPLFHAGQQRLGAAAELEMVTGLPQIHQRLSELARASTRSAYVIEPNPERITPELYAATKDEELELIHRGLDSRSLVAAHMVDQPVAYEHYRVIHAAGEQVRSLSPLPLRAVIFDRETALVPIDPEMSARGALVIRAVSLVCAIVTLYDLLWEAATPVFEEAATPLRELDATDRRLLRMLVAGAKDEAISRQLGLGLRTVRRRIADMMTQLDTTTRFQAGVEAQRRGWLD